jgi:hypothetical protein
MIGATCLVHQSSAIKPMKLELSVGGRELHVGARRSISAGTVIYELYAAMPSDVDMSHVGLSQVLTGDIHSIRLLNGPMRLVSHHRQPNYEVCSLLCFHHLHSHSDYSSGLHSRRVTLLRERN